MKRIFVFIIWMFGIVLVANGQPLTQKIIDQLALIREYSGEIGFNVTLPMTDNDVTYRAKADYALQPADTLCGYFYYIDVASDSNPDIAGDFISYFDGTFLNFSNKKLREYHADSNPAPFRSRWSGQREIPGVQRSGLFAGELPVEIGRQLSVLINNPQVTIREYADTTTSYGRVNALSIEELYGGEVMRTMYYEFDALTGCPLYKEVENNPGHIGSQTVTTRYDRQVVNEPFPESYFSEERLMRDKGDVFSSYRSSLYRSQNLKGAKAPVFVLSQLGSDKRLGLTDSAEPAIVAFVNLQGSFCNQAASLIQRLSDSEASGDTRFLLIFPESDASAVSEFVAARKITCPVLYDGTVTALDYGVVGFPAIFVIDADRKVRDVYPGYSNDLEDSLLRVMEEWRMAAR